MSLTSKSNYVVHCPCGHEGRIQVEENANPYSKHWEKYTFDKINGREKMIFALSVKWERALEETEATCPKCGSLIQAKWIQHESETKKIA